MRIPPREQLRYRGPYHAAFADRRSNRRRVVEQPADVVDQPRLHAFRVHALCHTADQRPGLRFEVDPIVGDWHRPIIQIAQDGAREPAPIPLQVDCLFDSG